MPINTVQQFVKQRLDGMVLPLGLGNLDAFIAPPNPRDDPQPAAYVWGSHGDEKRLTVPRATYGNFASGGDKTLTHRIDVWLVWFTSSEDPQQDIQFPAVIDAVMNVLRNAELVDASQHERDPVTGQLSQLLNMGEHMTWDYGPIRATADQRYMRCDAVINVEVEEVIQA